MRACMCYAPCTQRARVVTHAHAIHRDRRATLPTPDLRAGNRSLEVEPAAFRKYKGLGWQLDGVSLAQSSC